MRKIRILDIFPDIYSPGVEQELKDRAALKEQLLERTNGLVELDCRCVEKGSESIECFYDAGMVVPYIVRMAEQAQKDGYDAAVLDCFMDPGLGECREYLTMPVFGVCQSACSLAMRLGGEFSVIGILEDMDRCIKENLRRYGLIGMLANIRWWIPRCWSSTSMWIRWSARLWKWESALSGRTRPRHWSLAAPVCHRWWVPPERACWPAASTCPSSSPSAPHCMTRWLVRCRALPTANGLTVRSVPRGVFWTGNSKVL